MSFQTPPVQLHFAHANGFPSGSYRQVFRLLPANLAVLAKPHFALEPHFKSDKNWHTLVNELIQYCEKHKKPGVPLWAVGHSMGAIVSYKACCNRPDLFDGLIMLDPPLVTGAFTSLLKMVKKTSAINKITPASLSAVRKSHWKTHEDPVSYFKSKALFRDMKSECIEDYVEHGLKSVDEGRTLVIDAAIEAQLFRHIPDDLNAFKGRLKCPGYLVTGQKSKVCKPIMYKRFAKKNQLGHVVASGGHMFPLEHPLETARLIAKLIEKG